jgi:hypothetical protein
VAYQLDWEIATNLPFDLDAEIETYRQAVAAHKLTIGIPAPVADPLVETIVSVFGGAYEIINEPPPPPPPPPVNLYAIAADARYIAETNGVMLDGVRVLTDRDSQGLINGAVSLAQINPAISIRFKTAAGIFVTLNATQVLGIGLAVGTHVQNCFAREADVAAEIAANILTTPAAVRARFADLTLS